MLPCAGACVSERLTVQVLVRLYIECDGYKSDFVYFVCACARTTTVLCEVRAWVHPLRVQTVLLFAHTYTCKPTRAHVLFSHPAWTHVLFCSCMILMLYPWLAYKSQRITCPTYKILFIGVKTLFTPSIWARWHSAGRGQYKKERGGGVLMHPLISSQQHPYVLVGKSVVQRHYWCHSRSESFPQKP